MFSASAKLGRPPLHPIGKPENIAAVSSVAITAEK
jgi:hypothetical protein